MYLVLLYFSCQGEIQLQLLHSVHLCQAQHARIAKKPLPHWKPYTLKLWVKFFSYFTTSYIFLSHMSLSTTSEMLCFLLNRTANAEIWSSLQLNCAKTTFIIYPASNLYLSQQPVFLKFSPQFSVLLSSEACSSERRKLTQWWISSPEKGTIQQTKWEFVQSFSLWECRYVPSSRKLEGD